MSALYEDGTPIPDDKLAEAQAAGQVRFASPEAEVNYVDSNGRRLTATAADYQTITSRGGRIEPAGERAERERVAAEQAEFESPTEMAKTAAEGVVRGVPLVGGTLYAGLIGTGVIDRERSAARQRINPGIELAGEVLSPLPGAAIAKGAGLAAKALGRGDHALDIIRGVDRVANAPTNLASRLATAVEHGAEHMAGRLGGGKLAQKVTGYAAGGAIDGAQYAVNQEIAQAAQEGRLTELDGKTLWAALGHGAAVGGVIGAGLGAGIEGARAVSSKLQGYLAKEGQQATLRAAGLTSADLVKATARKGEEKVMRAAKRLQEEKLVKVGNSVDDNFKLMNAALTDANKELSAVRKGIDSASVSTMEHVPVTGIVKRGGEPVTRAVERRSLALDAAQMSDRLRSAVHKPSEAGIVSDITEQMSAPQLRKFEREILAPIDARAAKGEAFTFAEAAKMRRKIADQSQSLKNPNGYNDDIMRDAQGALEDMVEESIDAAAKAGQLPEKALASYKAAKARSEDLLTLVGLAKKHLGAEGGRKAISGADQAAFALGAASALASGDSGGFESVATGLGGALLRRGVAKYQNPALMFLAQRLADFATRKNAATEAIVVGSLHQAASEPRNVRRAAAMVGERLTAPTYMQAVSATLAEADQSPAQEAAKYGAIAQANEPVFTGYLQAKQRATAWLSSQIPVPSSRAAVSLTPNADEPEVSSVEQRKFVDKFTATRDPIGAIEELAAGELNLDKIEAVRATAPELYEEVKAGVALGLAKSYEPVPFKRRIQLGMAFDLPADRSLLELPQIQSTLQPPPASEPGQRPSTTISKHQSQAMSLPSQQAAGGY